MTADNEQFLIDISDEIEKFDEFLNIENNDKIFFSGKFGIGKTFFLKEFAKQKRDDYLVIHLFPVNYQTRNNYYDIVELLKYDILTEILSFPEIDEFIDMKNRNLFSFICRHTTLKDVISGALSTIGDIHFIGKALGKPLGHLLEIDRKYQKKKNEKVVIDNFLKITQNKKIIEDDIISQVIRNILERIKRKKEKDDKKDKDKKTVLILDDLDRIDPDNIFRILNVFSSFYDRTGKNKFGFDKVIVVGDYENLRNIFHHKYGQNADFNGYIDKFYSIRPYFFDSYFQVLRSLDILFRNVKASVNVEDVAIIQKFLKYFFIQALKNNLANLRNILKPIQYQLNSLLSMDKVELPIASYLKQHQISRVFYLNKLIEILVEIFGSEKNLLMLIANIRVNIEELEEVAFYKHYRNYDTENFSHYFESAIYLMLLTKREGKIVNSYFPIHSNDKEFMIKINTDEERIEIDDKRNLEIVFLVVLEEYIEKGLYKEA